MSNHELITVADAKPIKAWIRGVPLEDEARKCLATIRIAGQRQLDSPVL
jgi:hypothetical protein